MVKSIGMVDKNILDNLYDGVVILDRDRKITFCNRGVEQIMGLRSSEMIGSYCSDILPLLVNHQGVKICNGLCPVAQTVSDGIVRENKGYLRNERMLKNLPVSIRVAPLKNRIGSIVGAVKVFDEDSTDLSSRKRIEELEKLALIDPLTGLPNRRYIAMNMVARLDEFDRYGWPFGVLFIDIDHFKMVNDLHGHDAGDLVLTGVARTLQENARSFDLIGRLGGEEFIVNLVNVDESQLIMIAERFRLMVEGSAISKGEDSMRVTVSIGATLARKGDTVDSLLSRADRLMYQSKRSGRNRVTADSSL
jgi:diguanylate cyclase (GGDEF)-like protein